MKTIPQYRGMTVEETQIIAQHLSEWGYDSVRDWAKDNDYLDTGTEWVDLDDQPIDIFAQILRTIKSYQTKLLCNVDKVRRELEQEFGDR